MILFPAIDILDGKAVRLHLGKRETAVVYGEPAELAKKWAACGAEFLHIVDLNAAFDNTSVNDDIIKSIRKAVNIPLQLGGGFKSMDRIKYCLEDVGIDRAIIGSAAVTKPDLFKRAAELYGGRIICGVDERNGKVSIKGWTDDSETTPAELCREIKKAGITTVVYTDITRDGALSGVNVDKTFALQKASGLNVIASGGVASVDDIIKLKEKGIYGAILGKALYTGAIDLIAALEAERGRI
ncbi:MAG: 1-(5-phosphoribosyl)-5-[(5-phosphoribosylamino)methylideneamino]imidazole-4-carboxamide isomerase [Clostridiales bacterium]|jgi:phosphoribosylformimino-5-aminoimidazole carboxamide ribotide isomerase|nr:1-(5-phosphoribosyl)-5-[(5-phosphoribosylamino)methylideneamino]imidazole-4-carboxamide isomerase [Clostridiales bacterium]